MDTVKIIKKRDKLDYFFSVCVFVFMPPTSKKLRGHIGLGLSVRLSVCPSVRLSVRNTFWKLRNSRTPYARILKFYVWHIHEK